MLLQPKSLLLPDVGAAVSILLGFAPPSTLSSESSDKVMIVIYYSINFSGLVFLLLEFPRSVLDNSLLILQLNEVLMPNPFNRPRAVFMLEIDGVEGV